MESLITEYTVVPIKWDRAYQQEIEAIYNIYDEQRNKILDLTCQDSGVTLGNYLEDLIRSTNVFVVIDKDNNICGVFSLGDMWKYKGQVITCKVHAIIPKQFWGKQSREIMKYFKDYAVLNFNIRKFIATVPQCGYGIIKLLKDLGFQHEGTMKENLVYLDKNNNPKLYDELVYGLIITNRNITEIQSFNTLGAEIHRFPRQVHYIAGDCWIDEYCGIAELPDDLTIGGTLTINYSKALDMLPDGLKVGSLRLWSHIVTEIPDDLQVSHNLDITAPVKKVENFSCNNVYLLNKGELTHLKNVHAKGTLTIYLYENRPLTIYPDVTADKGIIAYYIYENHKKSQTYNFADVTELYAEFPQLAPDEFKPFDYSDEDME